MSNNASPVPFRTPPRPLSVSPRSPTSICTLPTRVGTLALSSLTHMWLCLCSCLFLLLCVCCTHCVCAHTCSCACWCVCAHVLCLLMCLWLPCAFAHVFACVFRVCVCVCVCLYFGQSTCISIICTDHACLN